MVASFNHLFRRDRVLVFQKTKGALVLNQGFAFSPELERKVYCEQVFV